ncbi:MAG: hypothetical protein WCK86_23740 [Planctomycetia bacterium]
MRGLLRQDVDGIRGITTAFTVLLLVDAQKTENPPPATQVQRFAMTFLSSQDPRTELPQLYREPDCYHAFGRQMLDKSGRHVESDIVL